MLKAGTLLIGLLLAVDVCLTAHAHPGNKANSSREAKGRLRYESSEPYLYRSPVSLSGGSSLTLISPREWSPIGTKLRATLEETHIYFSRYFGEVPPFKAVLRLMEEQDFYESTGAPSWTNALYFRGQIIIPIPAKAKLDMQNIYRSVRHEYTHALISAITGGRCPGWLDEGLAQWSEGTPHPALRTALASYVEVNPPVPLKLLQGGFTRLDNDMVAAAYGQSLFAVETILKTYGFSKLRAYFDNLRNGQDKSEAFSSAFEINEGEFEQLLGRKLTSNSETSPVSALRK
ncbi:MAG: hypothetical protein DCC75_09915 [Proteobacteria bacterium]|nr:MAG: hypothetical protein DCC75_09915 [Pseudomonadota bacterium]